LHEPKNEFMLLVFHFVSLLPLRNAWFWLSGRGEQILYSMIHWMAVLLQMCLKIYACSWWTLFAHSRRQIVIPAKNTTKYFVVLSKYTQMLVNKHEREKKIFH